MFGVHMNFLSLFGLCCFVLLSMGCFSDPDELINMDRQIDANIIPWEDLESSSYKCRDNRDNDGDGLIDCDDPDCDTTMVFCDDPESIKENTAEKCIDGADNDGDFLLDCDDPDCDTTMTFCNTASSASEMEYEENTLEKCMNGADDDNNSYIDCDDPGCESLKYCENYEIILKTGSKSEILDGVVIHTIPGELDAVGTIEAEDFVPMEKCRYMGWPFYETNEYRVDWHNSYVSLQKAIIAEYPEYVNNPLNLNEGPYDIVPSGFTEFYNGKINTPIIDTTINPMYPNDTSWVDGVEFRKGGCGVDCISLDHLQTGEMYSYAVDFQSTGWYTINPRVACATEGFYEDLYIEYQILDFYDHSKIIIDPDNPYEQDDSLTVRGYFNRTSGWEDFQYSEVSNDSLALFRINKADTFVLNMRHIGVPASLDKIAIRKVSEL